MVRLSPDSEFIVLEGDEYLSSPIDPRPKFHLYKPNITLISGTACDHINVFPTFETYKEQFRLFIESIVEGGILVYNDEDNHVIDLVSNSQRALKKYPYRTPEHHIEGDVTYLSTEEGDMPLEIFGRHNLQNLAGARWICQHMGIDDTEFYEAISSFKGAGKRLERLVETKRTVLFKDFAHAPSKVRATVSAVAGQYPERMIIAVVELHTFSSLNQDFIDEYKGSLDRADDAVVFYSPEAVENKKLQAIDSQRIREAFDREDLTVFTSGEEFQEFLFGQSLLDKVILLMSSGNYGGLDFETLIDRIKAS
jgi:UDP-N-acetylmuramate: L-alanyl-gamma-D-glutamyl-meso-diaminopimelate ligase